MKTIIAYLKKNETIAKLIALSAAAVVSLAFLAGLGWLISLASDGLSDYMGISKDIPLVILWATMIGSIALWMKLMFDKGHEEQTLKAIKLYNLLTGIVSSPVVYVGIAASVFPTMAMGWAIAIAIMSAGLAITVNTHSYNTFKKVICG